MTTEIVLDAPRTIRLNRDVGGYRTYTMEHIVQGFDYGGGIYPGPVEVLFTPGLPVPGNFYIMDNDADLWAWVRLNVDVDPFEHKSGPIKLWKVTNYISNMPPERWDPSGQEQRNAELMCANGQIEDPLLQPMKVSGSYVKDKKEATHDRFRKQLKSSSHEQLRGPQVEFEQPFPKIRIEQNVALLNLELCNRFFSMSMVNSQPMWGLPARAVRCATFDWEKLHYGLCYYYYKRVFEFECKVQRDLDNPTQFIGGWDRYDADEGTKCIKGKWIKDPAHIFYKHYVADSGVDATNPGDFIRFLDFNGNAARTLLTGDGYPVGWEGEPPFQAPAKIKIEKYEQDDLFQLGLPIGF